MYLPERDIELITKAVSPFNMEKQVGHIKGSL